MSISRLWAEGEHAVADDEPESAVLSDLRSTLTRRGGRVGESVARLAEGSYDSSQRHLMGGMRGSNIPRGRNFSPRSHQDSGCEGEAPSTPCAPARRLRDEAVGPPPGRGGGDARSKTILRAEKSVRDLPEEMVARQQSWKAR